MSLPLHCTPCRVTVDGIRYQVSKDGTVRETWTDGAERFFGPAIEADRAKVIRHDASRQRRNRNRRERDEAMRSVGMVKTPYGWE